MDKILHLALKVVAGNKQFGEGTTRVPVRYKERDIPSGEKCSTMDVPQGAAKKRPQCTEQYMPGMSSCITKVHYLATHARLVLGIVKIRALRYCQSL